MTNSDRAPRRKEEPLDSEAPKHDRRRPARLAALPAWAEAEFTESKAAVMRIVGVEMLNNRDVCALHIKTIAAAAGVSSRRWGARSKPVGAER